MLVQTYALWKHARSLPYTAQSTEQASTDIARFIDDLIACVTYYPSSPVQIAPDESGHLIAGTQAIVQVDEQRDGMVMLRTCEGAIWITYAAYHQLVA
jgi:hypothetical protein